MNGIELAGVIKARPNPPAVVVIINAGSDAEFERQCAAAGADLTSASRSAISRRGCWPVLQQRFSEAWAEGVAARRISARSEEHRAHRIQRRVAERHGF
jgi:CheY-like chemotaxis protein